MDNSIDTIIIGAGISGLSAAYHLKKKYLLIEKSNRPGGLARSINQGGFTFDLTGHLIHLSNVYTKRLVKRLLKENLKIIHRNSWIYSNNTQTRYPFQANLYGLPPAVARECITGFVESILKYGWQPAEGKTGTFRFWVLKRFGEGFGKYFFFPYNEKLWTVSLDELTDDWTGKFVPRPSLKDVVLGAIYDKKTPFGYNVSFFYPRKGGIQSFSDKFFLHTENALFNTNVYSVNLKKKCVETDRGIFHYNNIISTVPLYSLVEKLENAPNEIKSAGEKLKWNSVVCLNLGFDRPGIGKDRHWIYFPEKKYPFYRVGFYHNFSKAMVPEGKSSMYVEIAKPCGFLFNSREHLKSTLNALSHCGIINKNECPVEVNLEPIECAYVIYDRYRSNAVKTIIGFLEKNNIHSIGRYGAWKYSYIEESILDGKETANKLKVRG